MREDQLPWQLAARLNRSRQRPRFREPAGSSSSEDPAKGTLLTELLQYHQPRLRIFGTPDSKTGNCQFSLRPGSCLGFQRPGPMPRRLLSSFCNSSDVRDNGLHSSFSVCLIRLQHHAGHGPASAAGTCVVYPTREDTQARETRKHTTVDDINPALPMIRNIP